MKPTADGKYRSSVSHPLQQMLGNKVIPNPLEGESDRIGGLVAKATARLFDG